MPRSATTGVFTRVSNSFSNPVFGTLIDPTDADALFDDQDVGLNPPQLAGPLNIINTMTLGTSGTAAGTLGFLNATSGSITLSPPAGALGTRTLTLPAATDTLVGKDTTDVLNNKAMNSPVINGGLISALTGFSLRDTSAAFNLTFTATSSPVLSANRALTINMQNADQALMTLSAAETVTGVKTFGSAGAVGKLAVAGNTSGSTVLNAAAVASGTLTLPAATDTLIGKATTDTLTNKTYDTAGAGNSFLINGLAATANTGTGAVARAAAPIFTTPTLGSAVATALTFSPTTGGIVGTTTNDSANAGVVGEYVFSNIASGSALAFTTTVARDITSISLTAGDWDVWINARYTGGATTTLIRVIASISTTTATLDANPGKIGIQFYNSAIVFNSTNVDISVGPFRIPLASTTTIFFVGQADFGVSTCSGYGIIQARRRR